MLIPAFNEAETIAAVVGVSLASGVGDVLVIDDGSGDGTARAARAAGAGVLELVENRGKGGAVAAGLERIDSDAVLLIDADLIGLRPEHLQQLIEPLLTGRVDMARGVFVGGRWRTMAAQRITPQLSGQRAVRRSLLLEVPGLARSRYGIEVAITETAKRMGWRCVDVPLAGVSQVMKEEKRGFIGGLATRLAMYGDIVRTLLRRGR